ncbi:neurotrimin-like isoform X1 [Centruroides sculpturatus]|uniref:neurotrimin-like isoform X1 n=2 Tax=Centruroides sculpturatus TaxID=218467 RepID=UPI000C6EB726|nr:neurotrimin-like isoform X1 [Centruroides sculpturatus]
MMVFNLSGVRCFSIVFQWILLWIYADFFLSSCLASYGYIQDSTDNSRITEITENIYIGTEKREQETETIMDYWNLGANLLPTFDSKTAKNVTTQLGQTAYLHCIVNNLGDKTVSWIRRIDFHVLTVGLDTYTSEDRFQAIHIENTNDWALQIKFSQLKDAGVYECQVSSDPKISYFVNLTVLVAKAAINEAPDLYVKTGSSINLTCIITQSPEPPIFVFWYHDDRMINYDSTRGEITVQKLNGDVAISRLYIKNALPADSGNYTCGPSNAQPSSITVHILNGEKPAAMQYDSKGSHSGSKSLNPEFTTLYILLSILWSVLR